MIYSYCGLFADSKAHEGDAYDADETCGFSTCNREEPCGRYPFTYHSVNFQISACVSPASTPISAKMTTACLSCVIASSPRPAAWSRSARLLRSAASRWRSPRATPSASACSAKAGGLRQVAAVGTGQRQVIEGRNTARDAAAGIGQSLGDGQAAFKLFEQRQRYRLGARQDTEDIVRLGDAGRSSADSAACRTCRRPTQTPCSDRPCAWTARLQSARIRPLAGAATEAPAVSNAAAKCVSAAGPLAAAGVDVPSGARFRPEQRRLSVASHSAAAVS